MLSAFFLGLMPCGIAVAAPPHLADVFAVDPSHGVGFARGSVVYRQDMDSAAILHGSLSLSDGGTDYEVGVLGRIGGSGLLDWTAYYDPGPVTESWRTSLWPVADNPSRVVLMDQTQAGSVILGGFDLPAGNRVFGYEFATLPDPARISRITLGDGSMAVIQDGGSEVSVLIVDSEGTVVLDRSYTSPLYLADPAPVDAEQFVAFYPESGGSGFFLMVQTSVPGVADTYENTFIISRLDAAGGIVWNRSFEMETSSLYFHSALPAPEGSFLFPVFDSTLDSSSFATVETTRLVKVAADGSLGWARELTDANIGGLSFFAPDSSMVWLSGFDAPSDPLDVGGGAAVAVRMDYQSGSLLNELRLGPTFFGLFITHLDATHVYLNYLQGFFEEIQLQILRTNHDFSNLQAFVWEGDGTASVSFGPDSELLLSHYAEAEQAIYAVSLDSDFTALTPGCPGMVPAPLTGDPPALAISNLPLLLTPATVTAAPGMTALSPASPSLVILPMTVADCGGATPTPVPLSVTINAAGELVISFPTTVGGIYELHASPDLITPFTHVDTLTGTGNTESFIVSDLSAGRGFFKVGSNSP